MLHPGKFVVFLFLFFSIKVSCQEVHSVTVQGNHDASDDDIISWSGASEGVKIYKGIIDSIKYRLAAHFADIGYLNSSFEGTRIMPLDSASVDIVINVNQGVPTFVKKLKLSGLDSTQYSQVFPFFEFLINRIYNKSSLEDYIGQSLIYFEDNGYPFAKIKINSIYFYHDSLSGNYNADIYLDCIPGILSKIDNFEIVGNSKTKDDVILRELRIRKGERYSQKIIDEIPKRLNRLAFFDPVQAPEFFLNSKNEGILRIKVKEKQTNNFDGIIGYIPSAGQNRPGYLTGLVNISLRNIFGTGRAAAINWQQYNRYSQDLQLKYLEPWIFGYPFNVEGSISQRKQDTSYVQRTLGASVEYLATESISASLSLTAESVIPTENSTSVFTVFHSSSTTTGLNLKIDTRDDPYAPTEGILFLNTYSYSQKKITGPEKFLNPSIHKSITLQRIMLDISAFYQIFNRQVIAMAFHGRELRGSSFFETSDLFRLGGANSLRGYREDQFLGNRIFWTNSEYRVLLTRRTFGFLFFDTGYFLRNAEPLLNVEKSEGFKIGYGIGLNLETSLGVLRVSFALAKGDTFSDAKIHFGIVNEF